MKRSITLFAFGVLLSAVSSALAVDVTFTKLTGITGGQIAGTGVWRADLSDIGLEEITQIVITDTSQGFGGFTGQFSGFDLDAIKLATTSVDAAGDVNGLTPVNAFNYFPAANSTAPGVLFSPGTQRAPVDPKLFASVLGTPVKVDPTIATFGAFDGNATIFAPFVKGFATMGDGGVLTFNLATPIDTTVADFHMFLYIGEVGDNGETAGGAANFIEEQDGESNPNTFRVAVNGIVAVPEPSTIALLAVGLIGTAGLVYRRRRK